MFGVSRSRAQVPVGVHLYPGGVSVVATELRNGTPAIRGVRDVDVDLSDERSPKESQAQAIREALAAIGVAAESCILAPQPSQTVVRRFKVEVGSKERHVRSAAMFEADEATDWTQEERVVALDPLPNTIDRMISIARRDVIDLLVETAKEAGLRTAAIDAPLAAWQRALCDRTDALLDLTFERPALFVFADPMGEQRLLPARLSTDKLAQAVRTQIVEIRRQRLSGVRRLWIAGRYEEMDQLIDLLAQDRGLDVAPLQFGTQSNPRWAFAAALATWTFAEVGSARK